tara:strand:- start:691 stop:996 length:306 start_codon:yes stop_codon:yes gene_type:complete
MRSSVETKTSYLPQIDDYVKWNHNGQCDEGWVYFTCPDYITIEVRVKDKCEQNIIDCPIHKKTHVLVVCHSWYWNELEYVNNRRSGENLYKSQQHRYSDPQ